MWGEDSACSIQGSVLQVRLDRAARFRSDTPTVGNDKGGRLRTAGSSGTQFIRKIRAKSSDQDEFLYETHTEATIISRQVSREGNQL